MNNADTRQQHLDRNYEAFKKMSFPNDQTGRFALMRNQEVIEVFDRMLEALEKGQELFSDSLFSIQEINPLPARIGGLPLIEHQMDPQRERELEEKHLAMMRGEVDYWEALPLPGAGSHNGADSQLVLRKATRAQHGSGTQA